MRIQRNCEKSLSTGPRCGGRCWGPRPVLTGLPHPGCGVYAQDSGKRGQDAPLSLTSSPASSHSAPDPCRIGPSAVRGLQVTISRGRQAWVPVPWEGRKGPGARANTGTPPASPRLCQVSAVCSCLRDEHNHPQPATVPTPAVPHPQASWQVCECPLRLWRHALGHCRGSGLDGHTSIRRRPEGFGAQLCSQSSGGAPRPLVSLMVALTEPHFPRL